MFSSIIIITIMVKGIRSYNFGNFDLVKMLHMTKNVSSRN
jgi:hypothetical protein